MIVFLPSIDRASFRLLAACVVILRAALGLFLHGLSRPFATATIEPRSGKVRPR